MSAATVGLGCDCATSDGRPLLRTAIDPKDLCELRLFKAVGIDDVEQLRQLIISQVRFLTEIVDDFRRFVDEIWRF